MPKTHYSDYVTKMSQRFVQAHDPPEAKIDRENWLACYAALKTFEQHEQDVIVEVYRTSITTTTFPDAVAAVARWESAKGRFCNNTVHVIPAVWALVNRYARAVAIERGLI